MRSKVSEGTSLDFFEFQHAQKPSHWPIRPSLLYDTSRCLEHIPGFGLERPSHRPMLPSFDQWQTNKTNSLQENGGTPFSCLQFETCLLTFVLTIPACICSHQEFREPLKQSPISDSDRHGTTADHAGHA